MNKATSKVISNNGNKVTTTTAKVKKNLAGKTVVKIKKTVDSYAPVAKGGRVFQGTKTTKKRKVL